MAQFVDRRLNPRDKSLGNRQRFLRRTRAEVRRAVDKAVAERSIADAGNGGAVSIPTDGIGEPQFHLSGDSGERERVLPGNKDFVAGDRIDKPKGGGGGGRAARGRHGRRRGPFSFALTEAEFLDILFEDLELPDLVKASLKEASEGVPPGGLHQRRRDAEPRRAAHDARQHEPASGAAPPERGRGRAAGGGARGAACQSARRIADRLRVAELAPRSSA